MSRRGPDSRHRAAVQRDHRGSTPVVGKALEAGIVVLYIGLLTTVLYGGLVPDYRAAAGEEVGDRVLAETAQELQGAVPQSPYATAEATVSIPDTIRGSTYRLRAVERSDGYRLSLEHPHPEIDGEVPVLVPADIVAIDGTWESTDPAVITVEQTDNGRVVELSQGSESE